MPTAAVRAHGFETTGCFRGIVAFDVFNPVAILETASDVREHSRLNAALKADYALDAIIPGLNASAFYSLQTHSSSGNSFFSRTNKNVGGATSAALRSGRGGRRVDDS